jgi:hypothetical protein
MATDSGKVSMSKHGRSPAPIAGGGSSVGRATILALHVLGGVLLALVVGGCSLAPIAPTTQTLKGLDVEFQEQPAPPGFDQEGTLKRIRLEYGVGSDRAPDAVTYGVARCLTDPDCFGNDKQAGPSLVWLIEWNPDVPGESRRLLIDASTGALLRFE